MLSSYLLYLHKCPINESFGRLKAQGNNWVTQGDWQLQSAQKEIALWFKPSELAEYEKAGKGWLYESAV